MKRSRERDYDPQLDQIYEDPKKPLWVEPIATRTRRDRYGLPALIGIFIVAAIVVATISRFAVFFAGPVPTSKPAPTPIGWVDVTAVPTATPSPSSSASARHAGPTPVQLAPLSIRATITAGGFWFRGSPSHFTIQLTNTTPNPISMDPCPTYRMYLTSTDRSTVAPLLLNCAAIGPELQASRTVTLDMIYTPRASDPLGGDQTIVWEWDTPTSIQAIVTYGHVYIGQ